MVYVFREFLIDLEIYSRKQAISLGYSHFKNRLNIKERQEHKGEKDEVSRWEESAKINEDGKITHILKKTKYISPYTFKHDTF